MDEVTYKRECYYAVMEHLAVVLKTAAGIDAPGISEIIRSANICIDVLMYRQKP